MYICKCVNVTYVMYAYIYVCMHVCTVEPGSKNICPYMFLLYRFPYFKVLACMGLFWDQIILSLL